MFSGTRSGCLILQCYEHLVLLWSCSALRDKKLPMQRQKRDVDWLSNTIEIKLHRQFLSFSAILAVDPISSNFPIWGSVIYVANYAIYVNGVVGGTRESSLLLGDAICNVFLRPPCINIVAGCHCLLTLPTCSNICFFCSSPPLSFKSNDDATVLPRITIT